MIRAICCQGHQVLHAHRGRPARGSKPSAARRHTGVAGRSGARVPQGSLPPGDVASEPVVELARPAAAGLMSAAQAAVRLSGGDWGTMIWTTKLKGALLCL